MYNASVIGYDEKGQPVSCFVAEVQQINGRAQMLRSNAVQCTGYEGRTFTKDDPDKRFQKGDAVYDFYFRSVEVGKDRLLSSIQIVEDNCKTYKQKLAGLALPPAYKMED